MEDLLDDWEAAIHQSQSDGVESTAFGCVPLWKVCPFVSCFSLGSQVVRRHDIATRIKEINKDLEHIVKDKDGFELIKREMKQPERRESTSFVDVKRLLGRDAVKEDIIRILHCEAGEEWSGNIPTITIVGMGGIGKTSLAQLIYDDERIKTHFTNRIWVCSPNPFDQNQIARAILEDIDPGSLMSLPTPTALQSLLVRIREKIKAKKFLLILDDVWSDRDQDWEPLKATFNNGMIGSWILVTTRKESVAWQMGPPHGFPESVARQMGPPHGFPESVSRQMGPPHVFHLELLSEHVCWQIIAEKASTERSNISWENLEELERKIATKCKGSPLAAKTLGGLLLGKRREEWQNVLNSEIWKLDSEKKIISPLLLSYYDLPSIIRQCLSYCAIFPKNYRIGKDELIQHWLAQGYLDSDDNVRGSKGGDYSAGEGYFKYLATRSFFQDFEKDSGGKIVHCKMHDVVHDFVQFLTANRFVTERIVATERTVATERVQNLTLDSSTKNARHLRLEIFNFSSSPMSVHDTEKLRSLVVVSHGLSKTSEALLTLVRQSKHLRLLQFNSCNLDNKEIACGIGNLIHLRYLSLISCFELKLLPEAVCELPKLQYLKLKDCCSLEKLPVGIGKLTTLRCLCIERCYSLIYYPKGIRNLTSLMRLSGIKMRIDRNDPAQFSIGDLENLDLLVGKLCVEVIGNAVDCDEVKRAKLHNKEHLKTMDIWICSPDVKTEEVLQALNPPPFLTVTPFDYRSWVEQKDGVLTFAYRMLQAGIQYSVASDE